MFGYQSIIEVFQSMQTHKVRTVFTGFGVMWAMLLFVLLQGGGMAYHKYLQQTFGRYTAQKMVIFPGVTRSGSAVTLRETLADHLNQNLNLFKGCMPILAGNHEVCFAKEVFPDRKILGIRLGYETIEGLQLAEGRFLVHRDFKEQLPVCLIGNDIKKKIFGNHSAVGAMLSIDGMLVAVVGVLDPVHDYNINHIIALPHTLFSACFPTQAATVDHIVLTLPSGQNMETVKNKVHTYLMRQLRLEVGEEDALYISMPSMRRNKSFRMLLFVVMKWFIFLIGFCFLLSGLVGVSNMMLIVVRERAQEFAVRKVMGAGLGDIMGLILLESIIINVISGILGMAMGMAMIRWVNSHLLPLLAKRGIDGIPPCVLEPTVVVAVLMVLMVSGGLAGLLPARRAWRVKPVEALNSE